MTPSETCRSCGQEIVRGLWFDPAGGRHEGAWVHAAGGVLCPSGGIAEPSQAAARGVGR